MAYLNISGTQYVKLKTFVVSRVPVCGSTTSVSTSTCGL